MAQRGRVHPEATKSESHTAATKSERIFPVNEQPREVNGGLGRRSLLKSGLAVGLGAAGLAAGVTGLTPGVARADSGSPQYGWRYCANCHSLYWGDNGGYCAWAESDQQGNSLGSYTHIRDSAETIYGVPTTDPGGSNQSPWRYCRVCSCLNWGPEVAASRCAGNANDRTGYYGPHTNDTSGVYYMPYGNWSGLQNGWRFCTYCKALFWGSAINSTACPTEWESHLAQLIPAGPHTLVDGESLSQVTSYALYMQ
jgi:hypothetical protein